MPIFVKTAKTRFLFFLLSDAILISLAIFLAFLIRFEEKIPKEYIIFLPRMIFLTLVFCIPTFYFYKLYLFSWSYVSANELISLFKATTISFFFLVITIYLFRDLPFFVGFPRSIIFIGYFLVFIFCGGIRFAKRIWLIIFNTQKELEKEKTLIVGAGDAGEQILRSVLMSKHSPYLVTGFIDDNPLKIGTIIHGVKVIGKREDISWIVKEKKIKQLIIALPLASKEAIKDIVELARKAGLKKIKIVPPISEIINGNVSFENLKEIGIEDLLGREPVKIDIREIEAFIFGKKILITGSAGSIGSELSRQVAKFKPSLLLLIDQDETGIFNIGRELKDLFSHIKTVPLIADIQDKEKIEEIFEKFRPDIVFHAAAYKHVPLMENQPEEAVKNNIFGLEVVAKTAIKDGTEKFIFISTDKAVNPSSVMGATKRAGEMICQALNQKEKTKFISVRFGNVLDSRGSVIPIFREQIKKGGPIEVTHPEMKRYFMLTSEACLLVLEAASIGKGGEIFVLDMGKPIKILDLAKEMIKLSGLEPDKDIPIVFTGLRPGEKIFEEILTAEEGTIATRHQKIFITCSLPVDEKTLNMGLDKLKEVVKKNNKKEIIEILKEIVPSYKKC